MSLLCLSVLVHPQLPSQLPISLTHSKFHLNPRCGAKGTHRQLPQLIQMQRQDPCPRYSTFLQCFCIFDQPLTDTDFCTDYLSEKL